MRTPFWGLIPGFCQILSFLNDISSFFIGVHCVMFSQKGLFPRGKLRYVFWKGAYSLRWVALCFLKRRLFLEVGCVMFSKKRLFSLRWVALCFIKKGLFLGVSCVMFSEKRLFLEASCVMFLKKEPFSWGELRYDSVEGNSLKKGYRNILEYTPLKTLKYQWFLESAQKSVLILWEHLFGGWFQDFVRF